MKEIGSPAYRTVSSGQVERFKKSVIHFSYRKKRLYLSDAVAPNVFYKHQCTLHSKQRFTGCWIGDADGLARAGALPLAVHIILEDVSVKYLLKDALPGHGAKAGGATATTPLALITRRFVRFLNFPGFRLFFLGEKSPNLLHLAARGCQGSNTYRLSS